MNEMGLTNVVINTTRNTGKEKIEKILIFNT